MRLTVLGRSPAAPNAGEACSGYLVEGGDTRLLVDIGPGVVAQLIRVRRPSELTAVIVSHMHPDHLFDLVTLRYAFPWLAKPARRLPVFMPPGSRDQLTDLARGAGDARFFESTFDITEHDGESDLAFGSLRLKPMPTQHYVPTWGFRITEGRTDGGAGRRDAGRTLAYSADSGPCDPLVELARNSDLFLCEAALRAPEDDPQPLPHERGHLTAIEAAQTARVAGARRLLLTHLEVTDGAETVRQEATTAFGSAAEVAEPLGVYDV